MDWEASGDSLKRLHHARQRHAIPTDRRPTAMETHDERIPREAFTAFVSQMPQISVELAVERDGAYLLGRRVQEPAKGGWFWPGSRLYKGETFEAAVDRVAREELGMAVDSCCQLGTYNHFWDTDVFDEVSEKHTVNVAYHVHPSDPDAEPDGDDQHDEWRWVAGEEEGLHPYVEAYLADPRERHGG